MAAQSDDAMGVPHRAESMRDENHRTTLADCRHVARDDCLALVVQRTGCLVEYQDTRVGKRRSDDRDALPLSARQTRALLSDQRVVTLWELADEVVRPRELSGTHHLFDRGNLQVILRGTPVLRRAVQPGELTAFHEALRQALQSDVRRPRRERRKGRALYAELKAADYDGG
jgi:hypothetical protein